MHIVIQTTPNNVIVYLRAECGTNIKAQVLRYLEEGTSVIKSFGEHLPIVMEDYNEVENYEE